MDFKTKEREPKMNKAHERIHDNVFPKFAQLTKHQQGEILAFLQANPRHTIYNQSDLVEAWLCWNGIINYSEKIADFFFHIYKK